MRYVVKRLNGPFDRMSPKIYTESEFDCFEARISGQAEADAKTTVSTCFAIERNLPLEKEELKAPPLDSNSSRVWMNKWKNRTPVKFVSSFRKRRESKKKMADDLREFRKLSKKDVSSNDEKHRFAKGIQTLLLALEYIEKQEKLNLQLLTNRLNNRMHVMDGELEKAGEGAPDLAKLLEDHVKNEAASTTEEPIQNGIPPKEIETVPPVQKEAEPEEKAQSPAPEVKEEVKEEEVVSPKELSVPKEVSAPKEVSIPKEVSTPKDFSTPKDLSVEEAKLPSPQITPKVEESRSSPPPPPVEVSRKRSLDRKEPEPEGSSGSESDSSRKRNKVDQETETISTEVPNNRETRTPVEDERERMISEFVTEVSTTPDSLGEASERLAKEIDSLGELAAAKEMEWNAILRVRKLKEEMLERLLRRKRMHCIEEQPIPDRFPENLQNKVPTSQAVTMMRGPRFPDGLGKQQRPILPKPSPYTIGMNPREGRNGPIVDVKSIIDDYSGGYRSRHPESTPRRGRRVRNTAEQRFSSNPSLISMANMALGTGASVRTVTDHVYNLGMDQSRRDEGAMKETVKPNGAKPYPEVTLHPVSPPSLLHQVLTKASPAPRPASFSPTLARLLTAPERPPPPHFRPPSRVSIADILSSTKKNRNEITITPVSGTPPAMVKNKEDVVLLDDDDGEGGDRLVIDEGSEEVPQCQGCRQKSAQFVCAGCGNQWYCSRDCQVTAWEEHSEVCTG